TSSSFRDLVMHRVCTWVVLSGVAAALLTGRSQEPSNAGGPRVAVGMERLTFHLRDELVAGYVRGPEVAKPYFWPLQAPGGVAMTRAWPMEARRPGRSGDHVHQKSAWFCHGDVIPEGVVLRDWVKSV